MKIYVQSQLTIKTFSAWISSFAAAANIRLVVRPVVSLDDLPTSIIYVKFSQDAHELIAFMFVHMNLYYLGIDYGPVSYNP